jgi:hypothetical protein
MSLFVRLRLDIKRERVEINTEERHGRATGDASVSRIENRRRGVS